MSVGMRGFPPLSSCEAESWSRSGGKVASACKAKCAGSRMGINQDGMEGEREEEAGRMTSREGPGNERDRRASFAACVWASTLAGTACGEACRRYHLTGDRCFALRVALWIVGQFCVSGSGLTAAFASLICPLMTCSRRPSTTLVNGLRV